MTSLIKTSAEVKNFLSQATKPIGFVPTMGALHAGHVALINTARKECKTVVVSIFVNPTQFGPNEDFEQYPRDLESDTKACEENKVDFIFAPERREIYPTDESEKDLITPPKELTSILCGRKRIGHFEGVATVINTLFKIVQPTNAYFGEKDLQQLYILKWLIKKTNLGINIKSCPTVREPNNLACSSRNRYLNEHQKEIASNLYKSLRLAKENTKLGIFTVSRVIIESIVELALFPEIQLEYFEARDKEDLSRVDDYKSTGFYYLLAANIGNVRLIDNIEV